MGPSHRRTSLHVAGRWQPWRVIVCAVLGLLFNVVGIGIAGRAIVSENRQHGGPPIVHIARSRVGACQRA